MEAYKNNYQEYLKLADLARKTGISVSQIRKLKCRKLRQHLASIHGDGRPLSMVTGYLVTYYDVDISPQEFKKIMKYLDKATWEDAACNYRQHRDVKRAEQLLNTKG